MELKYEAIYKDLKSKIINHEYEIGDKFPPEPQLEANYNASRITVRHAIEMLVADGYIKKIHGIGTVVLSDKASLQLNSLVSFSQEHKKSESRIIAFEKDSELGKRKYSQLGISGFSTIATQDRLRIVDGIPMGYQKVYCPDYIGLTDDELNNNQISLYNLFDKKGFKVCRADETIEAILCPRFLTDYLAVDEQGVVLLVNRITYDSHDRVLEIADIYYRGDMYRYNVSLIAKD